MFFVISIMKSSHKNLHRFLLIFLVLLIISCSSNDEISFASKEYNNEINNWHTKRIENLKKANGWLNLVGLFWLEEGENSIGSAKENKIVFPEKAPGKIGTIIKTDSLINFICEKGVEVINNNKAINKIELKHDLSGNATVLETGSLRWFIIKRGERYGIRLRDLDAELLKTFKGIERFPISEKWKIEAKFIPYESPRKIMIPTILGTIEENLSPGKLEFTIDNKNFTLYPTGSNERLFIVFADLTSGEETYGAGRFLYADGPDSNNIVMLDFNKAYNPPCAFTKFATCPLPPDGNKLRMRITAGEKNYGKGH